ncbi:transducin/WD40 repeat-like superfamily protein [Artemisia annua]|uniref:RING-type E3 ubiquitin transferase n=1 Tax=Artemisia annua TaxID=35608 RepID=A0A2U1MDP5_ARTAN|nr:transducin/WD40 repeat-like superfamily protein [Artemisia annua]
MEQFLGFVISYRLALCPQCNRRSTLKDIRVLYAARLCAVDDRLHKQVRALKAKCDSLEKKNTDYCNKEVKFLEREADLSRKVQKLTEEKKSLERLLEDRQRESQGSSQDYQRRMIQDIGSGSQPCSGIFKQQGEFRVDGGRYFDIDASGQLIIVARRLNGMGGMNLLTKISLVAPNEREDIQLPENTKAVRALCVKPDTRLALLASLGKKLSVVSTESNNTVLTYDLPAPAWSCSWDINSSHHIYTGLQNGMVMAFDIRQTRTPLESRTGLSCNPVHTVISVASDSSPSGTRTLLSASQIGMCEWNIDCSEERPYLIPESANQGVCISLAHSGVGDIVASFRPKIEMSASQPLPTPSMSCGVEGSHIFYKRNGTQSYHKTCSLLAQVDSMRLPKSTIINKQNHSPMFVSTNEVTSNLVLHDMSKLAVVQRLRTPTNQIWDMRCTQIWNTAVLSCLSGDTVQIFS